MNPIKWLLRDKELESKEQELNEHLDRLKERVLDRGSSMLIEVDIEFPDNFTRLSQKIASGKIEWRDFYCNEILDIYSVHCRMEKGSLLREHRHPNYDEYIYVVSGTIISWKNGISEGKLIKPPEKVERTKGDRDNIEGWYIIPSEVNHRIQSLEDHTHFVSKFLKSDV